MFKPKDNFTCGWIVTGISALILHWQWLFCVNLFTKQRRLYLIRNEAWLTHNKLVKIISGDTNLKQKSRYEHIDDDVCVLSGIFGRICDKLKLLRYVTNACRSTICMFQYCLLLVRCTASCQSVSAFGMNNRYNCAYHIKLFRYVNLPILPCYWTISYWRLQSLDTDSAKQNWTRMCQTMCNRFFLQFHQFGGLNRT